MFKAGDRVVYIGGNSYNEYGLYYGELYEINYIYFDIIQKNKMFFVIKDKNIHIYEKNIRIFITEKEYRKQKLKKICLSQEKN